MEQYTDIIIRLGTNDITHQCRCTTAYDKDLDTTPKLIAEALSNQLTALVTITRVRCPQAMIHVLPILPRDDAFGDFGINYQTPSQSRFANRVTQLLNDQIDLMIESVVDVKYVNIREYPRSLGTPPGKNNPPEKIMKDTVHVSRAQSTRVVRCIIDSMKD